MKIYDNNGVRYNEDTSNLDELQAGMMVSKENPTQMTVWRQLLSGW